VTEGTQSIEGRGGVHEDGFCPPKPSVAILTVPLLPKRLRHKLGPGPARKLLVFWELHLSIMREESDIRRQALMSAGFVSLLFLVLWPTRRRAS
jgi:hypothetical protein